jgi:hypothetical protein
MFAFHSGQSTPNVRQGKRLVLWECAPVFGSRICVRLVVWNRVIPPSIGRPSDHFPPSLWNNWLTHASRIRLKVWRKDELPNSWHRDSHVMFTAVFIHTTYLILR